MMRILAIGYYEFWDIGSVCWIKASEFGYVWSYHCHLYCCSSSSGNGNFSGPVTASADLSSTSSIGHHLDEGSLAIHLFFTIMACVNLIRSWVNIFVCSKKVGKRQGFLCRRCNGNVYKRMAIDVDPVREKSGCLICCYSIHPMLITEIWFYLICCYLVVHPSFYLIRFSILIFL